MDVLRVVAQASQTGAYGGPFDTACNQATIAEAAGVAVHLFATATKNDEPKRSFPYPHTFSRAFYLGRRKASLLISPGAPLRLLMLTARSKTVHVSLGREVTPILAALIAILMRRNLVIQAHGMISKRRAIAFRVFDRCITRPILARSNRIVCLTEAESDAIISMEPRTRSKIEILGNPVLRGVEPKSDESHGEIVIFIGRLHERKNIRAFCEAAEIAEKEDLAGRYLIYGPDGGDLQVVEKYTQTLPESRLKYGGALPAHDVPAALRRADIFVLPSRNEPWGNVLVAAIATGLPTIVTASAQLADSISAAACGKIVADNSPGDIAASVDHILRQPTTRASMRRSALKMANERFADSQQATALLEWYETP